MAFPEDFNDEEILLALCIRPEELADPAAWCEALRKLARAQKDGPKTNAASEMMTAQCEQLFAALRHKKNRK